MKLILNILKSNNHIIGITLAVISYFFIILNSGYFSDDAYSMQIKGILRYENQNLFHYTLKTIFGWAIGSGRILVFSSYQYILFYLIENLILYKILVLLVLIKVFILFFLINKHIFKSKNLSFLITIISIFSIQLREFHDPILGFHGLIPFLAFFYLLQLYSLIIYEQKKIKGYLFFSLSLFFISTFMYEISFLFIFFNFILLNLIFKNYKNTLNFLRFHIYIFFFTILCFLILQIRVHFFSQTGVPDYKILIENNFTKDVFEVLFYQISSSFPLTYFFKNILNYNYDINFFKYYSIFLLTFSILVFFCYKTKILNKVHLEKYDNSRIAYCAAFFLFAPALLIIISPHKEEVLNYGFGYGYIFNFFSSFGIGYIALLIVNVFKDYAIKALIFLIFLIAPTNSISNIKTILNSNFIYKYPNRIISNAVNKGIFKNFYNDDTVIIRQKRYPSDWHWNYAAKTKKQFIFLSPEELEKNEDLFLKQSNKIKENFNTLSVNLNNQNIWILHYYFDPKGSKIGQFFLGKIDEITINKINKNIIKAKVTNIFIYQEFRDRLIKINLDMPIDFMKLIYDKNQTPTKYFLHTELKKFKF